ncbi:protoporphyrinogen/coproporphyrinogen oxidase [Bradyrhizobium sp.]|uniref:protoporphyrinogen/coproporphyrinogen oxidase n=1 Tax=Bradyrhizobium sp. TaxID=376 RepID=UPI0039E39279
MQHIPIIIVGAGPTGLGAAWRLNEIGRDDWLLVEAAPEAGGLARSFVDDKGFTWDIGGHVQFSHYEYFDRVMDELLGVDGWNHHERESWIWMRDRFIPYPLQNNLHRLPAADLNECLQGLIELATNPAPGAPRTFEDWILSKFGSGIASTFLHPYNFKVWAHSPSLMNASWVGERVATTDLRKVIKNLVFNTDDRAWGPNNTFRFPKRGGTGAIWKACAAQLPGGRQLYGQSITSVDLTQRTLSLADGSRLTYDALISTIPLSSLIKLTNRSDLQPSVQRGLLSSSSNIVGLGISGQPPEALRTKNWIYFPEADCPFYRVTVFSNYASANVPEPGSTWSLMCEVSESSYRPVEHGSLVDDVIKGALATRLVTDARQIVSRWSYRAEHGYPVPGVHRDEALTQLIPEFERFGVYSRGRFGLWKYEVSNQDHSFMQGVEAVERIVNSRVEITATDADAANSKKHPWPFELWHSSAT